MPNFAMTRAMMATTHKILAPIWAILVLTWFCYLSMCLWSLGGCICIWKNPFYKLPKFGFDFKLMYNTQIILEFCQNLLKLGEGVKIFQIFMNQNVLIKGRGQLKLTHCHKIIRFLLKASLTLILIFTCLKRPSLIHVQKS